MDIGAEIKKEKLTDKLTSFFNEHVETKEGVYIVD